MFFPDLILRSARAILIETLKKSQPEADAHNGK